MDEEIESNNTIEHDNNTITPSKNTTFSTAEEFWNTSLIHTKSTFGASIRMKDYHLHRDTKYSIATKSLNWIGYDNNGNNHGRLTVKSDLGKLSTTPGQLTVAW